MCPALGLRQQRINLPVKLLQALQAHFTASVTEPKLIKFLTDQGNVHGNGHG